MSKRLSPLLLLLILAGCASGPEGRYAISQDHAPKQAPDLSHLEPPQPRYEPKSRGGNKDYNVRGIDYQVLDGAEGFVREGTASWYGKKFHGHLTSNGEIYDMYGFSAAHKALPLPTYVKVTNLANDKSVVVRVNDRGPFHGDREIDLSYAAAHQLDMLKHGTTQVRVEAFTFASPSAPAVLAGQRQTNDSGTNIEIGAVLPPAAAEVVLLPSAPEERHFIQVAASSKANALGELKQQLSAQYSVPSRVTQDSSLYKLQLGPFSTLARTQDLLKQLREAGFEGAFKLIESDALN